MTCCGTKLGTDNRFSFRPNYAVKPLTEKFYARHERLVLVNPVPQNVAFYEEELEKRLRYDPRNNSYAPRTENQMYGWIEQKAPRYISENDRDLMLYPKKTDEVMSILRKIACDMAMERRIFGVGR